MAKLIYSAITSLDGFIADEDGNFDWAAPDEEVHTFINDLERPIGTYLYGRGMYDVMVAWEHMPTADEPACISDYANIWRSADKIVYSRTLTTVSSAKTILKADFDANEIRQLKSAAGSDLSIGGSSLAAQALKARLVDECCLFVTPVVVGGGQSFLPYNFPLKLELLVERRFNNGVVYLSYRIKD